MHWVTRTNVHLDRVASPWLISRVIDPDATFGFIRQGEEVPHAARAYGLPGAEFTPHDENGSTFRKLLSGFAIDDAALLELADAVESGIAIAMGQTVGVPHPLSPALAAMAEGMAAMHPDDQAVLTYSFPLYDALLASIWASHREDLPPTPVARFHALRAVDWASVMRGRHG